MATDGGPLGLVRSALEIVPAVRWAWRKLLERGLEVTILPTPPLDQPVFTVGDVGDPPTAFISAHCRLRLLNHRPDRPEVVSGARVALKRRLLRLWRRTVASVPLKTVDDRPVQVRLEPMSAPTEVDVEALERGGSPIPRGQELELVLVLDMVGPLRRVERVLTKVRPPSSL